MRLGTALAPFRIGGPKAYPKRRQSVILLLSLRNGLNTVPMRQVAYFSEAYSLRCTGSIACLTADKLSFDERMDPAGLGDVLGGWKLRKLNGRSMVLRTSNALPCGS